MNPQEQQLLAQLHDIALPQEPSWWPPAIGWWVVLILLVLLCAALFTLWRIKHQKQRREAWRGTALATHRELTQHYNTQRNLAHTLAQLSVLMRRVALVVKPRFSIAGLTDEQWLRALDNIGHTTQYSDGVGRLLLRHQYQRDAQIDEDELTALFELTQSTIKSASADDSASSTGTRAALKTEEGSIAAV